MTKTLERTTKVWKEAKQVLAVPRSSTEYERLVRTFDELLDQVGNNENHPLARLADTLATLIEAYENDHVALPESDSISALKYLMSEHGLKQKDMKEIGSQGIVSEVLNGKRTLNTTQIKKLSKRFAVSPAVFID